MNPETSARPRPPWLGWLAFLLAVLGMGGIALAQFSWTGMQERFTRLQEAMAQAAFQREGLRQQLREAEHLFGEQRQRLEAQETRTHEQVVQLAAQEQRLAEREARLVQQEERAHQALTRLYAQLGRPAQSWRVAEAAQLVELAAHRLDFDQDLGTARQALRAAGERLAETGDPRWESLRARIAQDLTVLEAVRPLDRSMLNNRLARLVEEIRNLPLGLGQASSPTRKPVLVAHEFSLASLAREGMEGLKSLVRIRRLDGPESFPSGWGDAPGLRQQLRFQLEGAHMAVQRHDSGLYDNSLGAALTWLDRAFDGMAESTQRFRAELEALRATAIQPALPDLNGTLQALRIRLAEEDKTP